MAGKLYEEIETDEGVMRIRHTPANIRPNQDLLEQEWVEKLVQEYPQ